MDGLVVLGGEILWYRVPAVSDARNWRWPTLLAVMAGRTPRPALEIRQAGGNPRDLFLENTGDADAPLDVAVSVTWSGAQLIASDALPGWTLRVEKERALFTPVHGEVWQLSPGSRRPIGWLRYDRPPQVQAAVEALVDR